MSEASKQRTIHVVIDGDASGVSGPGLVRESSSGMDCAAFSTPGPETSVVGIGYTLATGRLFCDFAEFQRWCETLLNRPILTHEFASDDTWQELRFAFESVVESNQESRADD